MDLKETVGELTIERLALAGWVQEVEEREHVMRTHPVGLACEMAHEKLTECKERVRALESLVRGEAVAETERTGNKKPAPGVTVKGCTTLSYSDEMAKAWAIKYEHLGLLRLDRRTFEKAAKILKPQLVTIHDTFKAYIARDLPAAIAKAAKEAGE